MRKTEDFKESEWDCKCGCDQPHRMDASTMYLVQVLRFKWGHPLVLSSAWRCENHPEEVTKDKPGQHFEGVAVDIKVTDGHMAAFLMREAILLGATGWAYSKKLGMVHLDWRSGPVVTWTYE